MEDWNAEKKLAVLADVRDTLCAAFTDAKARRKSPAESYASRHDAERNVALIADALVNVLDKIDDIEDKQNPAQGHRVVKRNSANNR